MPRSIVLVLLAAAAAALAAGPSGLPVAPRSSLPGDSSAARFLVGGASSRTRGILDSYASTGPERECPGLLTTLGDITQQLRRLLDDLRLSLRLQEGSEGVEPLLLRMSPRIGISRFGPGLTMSLDLVL
ncbi:hypothetical protein JW921_00625, partial [Candidatus Fermentibacterales bacterium]|nr:hypothetical protein [Candidatus Fermentibacterales bacterium]